jgi:hypothetical protein
VARHARFVAPHGRGEQVSLKFLAVHAFH